MKYGLGVTHICLSGHAEAVIFLTEVCKVNPDMKDRCGFPG